MTTTEDLDLLPGGLDWSHGLAMLDSYISDAIASQATRRTRIAMRRYIDAGIFLVRTRFAVAASGAPDPYSLTYIVSLPCRPDDEGAWADLFAVHWSRLELTAAHVMAELAATLRQQAAADGTVTVGTALTDPPPTQGA
jgi:hypothetical protein